MVKWLKFFGLQKYTFISFKSNILQKKIFSLNFFYNFLSQTACSDSEILFVQPLFA